MKKAYGFCSHTLEVSTTYKKTGSSSPVYFRARSTYPFDQMVAYYVRKGYLTRSSVKNSKQVLTSVLSKEMECILPDQAAEYDRQKCCLERLHRNHFCFDEATAIQWLRQLREKPQIMSDINTQFMQRLVVGINEAQLDLRELLNQNFCYDGKDPVPEQIHAYLLELERYAQPGKR
ncbi:MAG: hypothetical protein R2932_24190 [Caldilineaceae bacterium]